jgi:hypothetical protein
VAVAQTPPRVRRKLSPSPAARAARRTLTIRHVSGHRVIALIAVVSPAPKEIWLSNLAEDRVEKLAGEFEVPAWGLVTVRADL